MHNWLKTVLIITASVAALASAVMVAALMGAFRPSGPEHAESVPPAVSEDTQSTGDTSDTSEEISAEPDVSGDISEESAVSEDTLDYGYLIYKNRGLTSDGDRINAKVIAYAAGIAGRDGLKSIAEDILMGTYTGEIWHTVTGSTLKTIVSRVNGEIAAGSVIEMETSSPDSAVIGITGDISFAENWSTGRYLDSRGKGIEGIISPELVEQLKSYDFTMVNNEFCISDRGTPTPNKLYIICGKPERVLLYHDIGVDLVSLANNHVHDMGADAFADTMKYLEEAGIGHMGAGMNKAEASAPRYYIINGRKFAFLAGSRAEKYRLTPYATDEKAGVFSIYDPADMVAAIAEAKKYADYVIVYPHWGKENSSEIQEVIAEDARLFIDAGADFIVGSHAHELQGMEIYKGKLVCYNLGNFIFESNESMSCIIELHMDAAGEFTAYFVPCHVKNVYVYREYGEDGAETIEYMNKISVNTTVLEDGRITLKEEE